MIIIIIYDYILLHLHDDVKSIMIYNMKNRLRDDIKILLLKNHMTMTELALKMSKLLNKNISQNGLSQKLGKESLRYDELIAILEILDYELEYKIKNGK